MIDRQYRIGTWHIFLGLILIFISSILIGINTSNLQGVYSSFYEKNVLFVFILKMNTFFLVVSMSMFWIIILYMVHLFLILLGGDGEFKIFFYYGSFGFIILIVSGILNYFFVNELREDLNIDMTNLVFNDINNILKQSKLYKIISMIGTVAQIIIFIWLGFISRFLYKVRFIESIISSLIVLLLVYVISII